jgi:choline-sulfatase
MRTCLLFQLMLVLTAALPSARAEIGSNRPNVVFICTDDQARWSIGVYGNSDVRTPNLDRLSRAGARFDNAFTVTPVCSPSRASMFTSRYSTQFGIEDWINQTIEPSLGLSQSAVLWPELLREAGYTNMLIGKWHLGSLDEFHPTRQGYDRFFGFRGGGNTPMNPVLEKDGTIGTFAGSLPDLLVDEGVKFLDANRDRPFLLSVHFREPHAPYAPVPEIDAAVYRDKPLSVPEFPGVSRPRVVQLTRQYYSSVHAVDRNVGRLLDALDRLDLAKNTIVFFTSDHGYMIGHHGLLHKGNAVWLVEGKQGSRPNMFDDAIRVPLLVRWPNVVKPGTVITRVVSNLDIFPTVLEATGIGVPPNLKIEGRSVVPFLTGKADADALKPPWNDTLFGQYDMKHSQRARMRMLRSTEWKLIRHFEPNVADELYRLSTDPAELTNLIGVHEHGETLATLKKSLNDRMKELNDPLAE